MRKTVVGLAAAVMFGALAVSADEPAAGVLIFGGTRGVGLETVRLLESAGTPVTVMVRPTSDIEALTATSARRVIGDAVERDDVDKAFAAGDVTPAKARKASMASRQFEIDVLMSGGTAPATPVAAADASAATV